MEFRAQAKHGGMRVNEFLRREQHFSRRMVSSVKFQSGILVNGQPVFTSHILRENDLVTVILPEEISKNLILQDIPLCIVYEDEQLLAVNKPANMPVHPTHGYGDNTLANAVAGYYAKQGIRRAVRMFGRLDKDTTGLVLIAKNRVAYRLLLEANVQKYYLAIAEGALVPDSGRIDAPILEPEEGARRRVAPDGKPCATLYKTFGQKAGFSLLELQLLTGRTHQIRVHLSHLSHPLVGDGLYGGRPLLPRQALHACRMEWIHPLTGETMSLTAPMPADMENFWRNLDGTASDIY